MSLAELTALARRRPSADDRVLWAGLDQIIASSANFIAAILIARWLGKEEFGRYAIAWLGLVIAENIQIALITVPMQTFAGQKSVEERPRFAAAMLMQGVALALLLAFLTYVAATLADRIVPTWRLGELAPPLAALLLFGQLAEMGRRYYYAFGPPVMSFVVNLVRYGGQFVGLLALALFASPRLGLGAALSAMAGAAAAAVLVALFRFNIAWPSRSQLSAISLAHWLYGRWLLLANLIAALREAIVAASIGGALGLAAIGVFRAAQQLVNLVNVPAFAMHNVVMTPMGAAYAEAGARGVRDFARSYMLRYLGALAAFLAVIAAFGSWLMPLLYGPSFSGYGGVVALMAASVGLYLVRDACNLILRTVGRTELPFLAVLAGTVASLTLLYPLIHLWGLYGALVGEIVFGTVALAVAAWGLKTLSGPRSLDERQPRTDGQP